MTEAMLGYGVTLTRNAVAIAEISNVGGPSLSRDSVDVTHHASPDRWREFIKGLKDGGEVSFDINHIPDNPTHDATTGLLSDFANDTTIDTWGMTFPDGTVWTFPGFLTNFEPQGPVDDKLAASITIKVAGKPTLA